MRILNNLKTGENYLQIITLTMNSAFKEGTQGACNVQDRFSAKFQAPYIRDLHQNKRFAMSLAFLHKQMDFLQRLLNECVKSSTYIF